MIRFLVAGLLAGWLTVASAQTVSLNVTSGGFLLLDAAPPAGTEYRFQGTLKEYLATVATAGLHFDGGATLAVSNRLFPADANGSPIVGVRGGTTVSYAGIWQADAGNTKSQVYLAGAGRLVLESGADLDFINDSYFTRQLWVSGDGSGVLELAAGFVADRTVAGTVPDGLGSIRLGGATLVTHATESLPLGYRPRSGQSPQANGHLVFENVDGSTWEVRSAPQTYLGAVWFRTSGTVRAHSDLTHAGTTQSAPDYVAANAFQTISDNITVTKEGPGRLIFAAETAWRPGAVLDVKAGAVRWETDPAAGRRYPSGAEEGGPNLDLRLTKGTEAEFLAPLSRLASITNAEAEVRLAGRVELSGAYTTNHKQVVPFNGTPNPLPSRTVFVLGATQAGQLALAAAVDLRGDLTIEREQGFDPPEGTAFDLVLAPEITSTFGTLHDETDLGLRLEYLSDRVRVTTTRRVGTTGIVLDEDFRTAAFRHAGWHWLVNTPAVGFLNIGKPGADFALARRLPPTGPGSEFIWGVAELNRETFRTSADDVVIIRTTFFSDIAFNNQEFVKPEVALLHRDDYIEFGHDHATELSRHYFTNGGFFHLRPSVENKDDVNLQNAHHNGADTPSTLGRLEPSVAVFRPQGGDTWAEVYGMNARGRLFFPARALKPWNQILLSIPRSYGTGRNPTVASGVAPENVVAGMVDVHVGITHRTDATLDYVTDAEDYIVWRAYRGQTGTHLQMGDFSGDGVTNAADRPFWQAARGQVHDVTAATRESLSLDRERAWPAGPDGLPAPRWVYEAGSGALRVEPNGRALLAWRVRAPEPNGDLADPFGGTGGWGARVAGRLNAVSPGDEAEQALSTDLVWATLPARLGPEAFGEVSFVDASGYAGRVAVTMEAAPPDALDTFLAAAGLTGEQADALADPDGDGVSNLLEYAMGTDPAASDGPAAALLQGGGEGEVVTVRWNLRAGLAGVTVGVEAATSPAGPWSPVTHTVSGDGVEVTLGPGVGPFVRLRVTRD